MTTPFGAFAWQYAGVGNARATLRIGDPGFATGVTIYVDENHASAADTNTGLDPNWPKLTIGSAVSAITRKGTTIAVAPGTYPEAIQIPVTYDYCRIIGMGANPYQVQVGKESGGTTGYTFQVLAEGWEFANMLVWSNGNAATDLGAFHLVGGDIAANTVGNVIGEAQYTYIHDCVIRGVGSPDLGISLDGAPWYVTFENNLFIQFTGTNAVGIKTISTSTSVSQKNLVKGNIFQGISDDGGWSWYGETKYTMFVGNIFGNGFGADTKFVNVDGLGGAGAGTYNLFAGNYFMCNSGGTQEFDTTNIVATADTNAWAGNFALALGGASNTATYGIGHVEPDAAA